MNSTALQSIEAAEKLTQLSRRQLLDMTLLQLFDADNADLLNALFESCQITRIFHSRESYRLVREADSLEVNITVSRVHTKPNTLGVVAVRDISQRRQMEAELHKAQRLLELTVDQQNVLLHRAHLEAIVGSTPDAIISAAMDGTVLSWNPGAEAMFEYSAEEMIGTNIENLMAPDQRHDAMALIARVRKGEIVRGHETVRQKKNGLVFNVSLTLSPIRDDKGNVVGTSAVGRDITSRKMAEKLLDRARDELLASETQYRTIVNTTQEWIWEIDLQRVHTFSNPAIELILGYTPEEVVGKSILWMHEDDRRRLEPQLAELMARGEGWSNWVIRWTHKDGSTRYLESNAVPILDSDGRFAGYRGADRDITKRVHAEETLRARERELAHVSRLTTLGEIAAGIAHEINQPLSAISNFSDAALHVLEASPRDVDAPLKDWLRQISLQAVRCGDILRGLRRFTRKQDTVRRCVDVNNVLRDSMNILDTVFREHNVLVELQLPQTKPFVVGNETELQQVFVNLLRNACDAMIGAQVDKPKLCVRGVLDQADKRLNVTVADSGPGVDAGAIDNLFDPFFTTRREGMGMGLAISKSIIENHGGNLWLEPGSSAGACFHVALPIDDESQVVQ